VAACLLCRDKIEIILSYLISSAEIRDKIRIR
jgi:hypothetical protein